MTRRDEIPGDRPFDVGTALLRTTALAEAARFWALNSKENPLIGSGWRRMRHLNALYGGKRGRARQREQGNRELRAAMIRVRANVKGGR